MYTDQFCQSMPWGSSKHPPPLKPLPPLPRTTYLTLPEPSSNESLLSHPVPSPSLRIDMMTLHSEKMSYISSAQSFALSSTSARDSTSSIIEFAQSLLPPSPQSARPLPPANSVECRLQETVDKENVSPSTSPVSKRGATPDQLYKLCSELEHLHVERRDSAMFDTTRPKVSSLRRTRTEKESCHVSNSAPKPAHTGDLLPVSATLAEPKCQPRHQSYQPAESSFIDWDDEMPRLARVKKSIADLRGVTRVRSNSASIVPTKASFASSRASSPRLAQSIVVTTDINETTQIFDKRLSTYRPDSPIKLCKRRPARYRRTVFVMDRAKRFSQHKGQRKGSSGTIATSCSSKRKRISVASSRQSHHGFSRFNKLTSWMRKAMNRA